jgi:hypothetical protein
MPACCTQALLNYLNFRCLDKLPYTINLIFEVWGGELNLFQDLNSTIEINNLWLITQTALNKVNI